LSAKSGPGLLGHFVLVEHLTIEILLEKIVQLLKGLSHIFFGLVNKHFLYPILLQFDYKGSGISTGKTILANHCTILQNSSWGVQIEIKEAKMNL
jgi:hypothetical protein